MIYKLIYFDNRTESIECESYYRCVESAVKSALIKLSINGNSEIDNNSNFEVSVSFVNEDEIRLLNKQYRDKDSVTDVLSFPLLGADEINLIKAQDSSKAIGDIVICFKRATEQAKQYGHTAEREIAFLAAHSMLHLFGFDHETSDGEKEMFKLQEDILIHAGFCRA